MTKGFFQSYFISVFDSLRFNKQIAIFIASIIFAQFHLFYGLEIFVLTFIYSLLSGSYYEKSRSIVGLFIIHYLTGMGLLGGTHIFG